MIWCVMFDLHTACPSSSSTHTLSFLQRTDTHGSGEAALEEAGVGLLSGVTGEDEFGGFMVVEGKGCDTARFTFTFMHLADAFIQSDLQCIQAIHVLSLCVFPGN